MIRGVKVTKYFINVTKKCNLLNIPFRKGYNNMIEIKQDIDKKEIDELFKDVAQLLLDNSCKFDSHNEIQVAKFSCLDLNDQIVFIKKYIKLKNQCKNELQHELWEKFYEKILKEKTYFVY